MEEKRSNRGIRTWAAMVAVMAAAAAGVAVGRRTVAVRPGHQEDAHRNQAVAAQLWTCSMHPQVIQEGPGSCPICHMALTPLRGGEAASGGGSGDASVVRIDAAVQQNMGLRLDRAVSSPLTRTVRAVGILEEAQPNIREINLRVGGWVERLYADVEGMHVNAGQPLLDLYSPELQVGIGELIEARKVQASSPTQQGESTLASARRKLESWGLPPEQVNELAALDAPPRVVTFRAPISGHVVAKPIVQGAKVEAGTAALRLVDHSTLWLDAQVFEQDLPAIRIGETASFRFAGRSEREHTGTVIFVHPHVDPMTRAARVRLEIPNPDLSLRPGMYATVELSARVADHATLVPREAVIDRGGEQLVFVARGDGRFEPRTVRAGVAGDHGLVQIAEGLSPGEQIVVSGQFLIDSESRLQEAVAKFISEKSAGVAAAPATMPTKDGHAAHGPAAEHTGHATTAPAADAVAAKDPALQTYFELLDGLRTSTGRPVDPQPLLTAFQSMPHDASALVKAAEALRGKSIEDQRMAARPLSLAVVQFFQAHPPAASKASSLHIFECPMARTKWLQPTDAIVNPFYGGEMLDCGSNVGKIDLAAAAGDGK